MTTRSVDAVVVGAGPNGLVAANALVDAGWEVLVLEAAATAGGAVRSSTEVTAPGFTTDLFSAFYPLAEASPVIRGLDLTGHGLTWVQAPAVLAHTLDDGYAAVLHRAVDDTAAALESEAAGDGVAWSQLYAQWCRIRDPLLDALFTPFPPLRPGARLLRRLGVAEALELARLAVMPVRRLAAERFRGQGARLLLTGSALHTDIPPDSAGSAIFGWLLCMLGQDVGYPVPQGGSQRLAESMVARLRGMGGDLQTGALVTGVEVRGNRARAVRLADGTRVVARRGILADVSAEALYRDLVGLDLLPPRLGRHLDRFQWDDATVKVNWALREPIPWKAGRDATGPAGAGTVHLGVDDTGFVDVAAALSTGRTPQRPFLLLGQMTTADPTRSPAGTESVWAYTHLPIGRADRAEDLAAHVERMHDAVERCAPGFRDRILATHVQSPGDLQDADANLVGGAINAGSAALHQQLVFRPVPGLGRPETPVEGLYLASAATHPGGGVHGACGWNAARAALGGGGAVRRRLLRTTWGRLLPDEDA